MAQQKSMIKLKVRIDIPFSHHHKMHAARKAPIVTYNQLFNGVHASLRELMSDLVSLHILIRKVVIAFIYQQNQTDCQPHAYQPQNVWPYSFGIFRLVKFYEHKSKTITLGFLSALEQISIRRKFQHDHHKTVTANRGSLFFDHKTFQPVGHRVFSIKC